MDKETLRMQMLSGVITESEYKAKLEENIHDLTQSHKGSHSTGRPDFNKMTADEIEDYLEKDKDNPGGLYGRSLSIVKHILDKKRKEETEKESLNEHYVAGGIVGIGAINQIPSRAKADYEDAFEYFLSQKYSLNEMEDLEEYAETQPIDVPQGMSDLPKNVKDDPQFKKLVDYFKTHKSEAKEVTKNVKDELSSLKEAYKDKGKYYIEDAYGNKKEVTKKEYLKDKLIAIGLPAAALGFVGALMAGPLGAMDPGSILQAIGIAAGIGGAAGAALDYGKPTSIKETEVEESDLYEANPLEGGPGYMTKYRVGVLSALIADAEKDLIKYEEEGLLSPELTEKMKGTIEKLKSSREALKAQYREETGKDVKEAEEKSLYEAESPTKEEIAAFEAAVEQLMDMTGMSLEDATMAIGRAANAKTK